MISFATTDKETLAKLMRLEMTQEGRDFLGIMAAWLKNLERETIRQRDDIECRWGQGAAQLADSVINTISTARERLKEIEKMEKTAPGIKAHGSWV